MSTHVLDKWAEAQAGDGFAEATIRARRSAVCSAGRHAGVDPGDLCRDHLVSWFATSGFSPATRCAYLTHLTLWGAWLGRPELTAGLRRPYLPPMQPDPLPEQELEWLIRAVAEDDRMTAWVLLGAFAGLRTSESARFASSDRRGDLIRVKGKRGRVDFLPVPEVLAVALQPFDAVDGPLWPGVTGKQISEQVARVARSLDLPRFRYHRLRHRYGTAVYRVSKDILLTARLLRHESPVTAAGYAAVGDDAGRIAVDQLPGATSGTTTRK
jgi:integrase